MAQIQRWARQSTQPTERERNREIVLTLVSSSSDENLSLRVDGSVEVGKLWRVVLGDSVTQTGSSSSRAKPKDKTHGSGPLLTLRD